jgi:PAS domain S-box-containing protein
MSAKPSVPGRAAERGGGSLDYGRIFSGTPALIVLLNTDPAFTILDASDEYLRATNTKREQIVGRGLFEVFPDNPDEMGASGAANLRASLGRVLSTRRASTMAVQKYDVRRPESEGGHFEERYWSIVSSPVLSDAGEMLVIVHRIEDVTDLVRANKALQLDAKSIRHEALRELEAANRLNASVREREEPLRAVVETTPECVKIVAADGTLLQMNASGLTMIEADSVEQVIGCNVYDIIAPEYRERYRAFNERICGGEKGALEFDIIGLKGTRLYMETHAVPLTLQGGERVHLALTRDVTARRRAEEALRESDRRKDEFIATLAHELRNPLAPLRNALYLLRKSAGEDARTSFAHQIMERQVNHLVRLVDDLLEMSRISRGVFELRRARVELQGILRHAIETSEPVLKELEHHFLLELPGQPLWVEGDAVRLAQVFSNLLNNAARFTERRGTIALRAEERDGQAVISVRDNGRGFGPEAAQAMFEMFSRSDRSTGLGIGLALARRLVEMHGGGICGHSEGENRGAEFVVRLPVALAPAEARAESVARAESRGELRCRVLVADDNRDAAESLGALLEMLGSEVSLAFDGAQAVEAARTFKPDVALLDIGMPELDGYAAARRIRSESGARRVKLVALTGWGQDEDRRRAREAGFDEHLVKPAELDDLRALLASACVSLLEEPA